MTVVVGLKTQDAIVLAADREESDQYLRRENQKLKRFGFPSGRVMGIAGDGNAHFVDVGADRIKQKVLATPHLQESKLERTIETVLEGIYEKHIFATKLNAAERPEFGLIIGSCFKQKMKLFKTQLAAPLEVDDFAASGGGETYAETLLARFLGSYTLESAVLLCVYVVQQTKKYVCTVGGGTDVVIIKSDGNSATLTASLIKPLEERLEKMEFQFDGAFFSALNGLSWQQDAAHYFSTIDSLRREIGEETGRLFSALKSLCRSSGGEA